ncbi:MAG: 50S ribosomal protein L33 [Candidatus Woesebacteria bacterium]|nr:50S ribosomal protein L33 [Candidatus Woesebacteria bacterium]
MAQGKFAEKLIKLRCNTCKHLNYFKRKNKKSVERKIELKKFCKWCRKHVIHKEVRK